jgi:SAM-dependent methyltransferase
MKRIEKLGVKYPPGYHETIAKRYTLETVPYPYIVMHIGDARIRRHFLYPDLFEKPGDLLDYGCGSGDAIRQLIRDGYPADRITGFDVSDSSLLLGYDLYLDRQEMEKRVLVSVSFPFAAERFDLIYSGSVIHVIRDENEFLTYLGNACRALKSGGIFFGSTLGLADGTAWRGNGGPPRMMPEREIRDHLEAAGFSRILIRNEEIPQYRNGRQHLALFQFSATTVKS